MGDIIPRVTKIEERLNSFDGVNSELCQLQSNTSEILAEIRSCSSGSVSDCSISDISESQPEESNSDHNKHGLVMSDSDMTELATSIGKTLDCQVDMFNYSVEQLEPAMFQKNLDFVYINDSGKLGKYKELTDDTIKEMTAYIKELVLISSNILKVQPSTKVFLGSLPPLDMMGGRRRSSPGCSTACC